MSSVDFPDFTFDGQQIARDNIELDADGVVIPQWELSRLHDMVWFVLDTKRAQIRLKKNSFGE
jgi:hypothetical protein